jgi:hypothetical protein
MPQESLRDGVTHECVAGGLRPVLDLDIDHVLVRHGCPHDRAALERALQVTKIERSSQLSSGSASASSSRSSSGRCRSFSFRSTCGAASLLEAHA